MRVNVILGILAVTYLSLHPVPARAAGSPLSLESVSVEPQRPAPAALCRLAVRLKNTGARAAGAFGFRVKIDGQEETTYKAESYWVNVGPGTSETIALHNFWSPAAKAAFTVEVTLLQAEWVEVKREGSASTTTPVGPVGGLPVSATQSVQTTLAKPH